jgi:hypothetical protein
LLHEQRHEERTKHLKLREKEETVSREKMSQNVSFSFHYLRHSHLKQGVHLNLEYFAKAL